MVVGLVWKEEVAQSEGGPPLTVEMASLWSGAWSSHRGPHRPLRHLDGGLEPLCAAVHCEESPRVGTAVWRSSRRRAAVSAAWRRGPERSGGGTGKPRGQQPRSNSDDLESWLVGAGWGAGRSKRPVRRSRPAGVSGGACPGRGAAAPGSVAAGWGSGAAGAGPENGAAGWASGAGRLESGAGGVWESEAGLREHRGRETSQSLRAA